MPKKKKAYKLSQDLNRELTNAVRRFNRAIERMQKQERFSNVIIPEKVTIRNIKKNIKNKRDFNRELNRLNRLKRPSAESVKINKYGIKAVNYVIDEMRRDVKRINESRRRERERILRQEATLGGQPTGLTRGELGGQRLAEIQPKRASWQGISSKKAWEQLARSIEKQTAKDYDHEKKKKMQENYIKGLKANFGTKANRIISKVRNMTPEEFYNAYMADQDLEFDFMYDEIEKDVKMNRIVNALNYYLEAG